MAALMSILSVIVCAGVVDGPQPVGAVGADEGPLVYLSLGLEIVTGNQTDLTGFGGFGSGLHGRLGGIHGRLGGIHGGSRIDGYLNGINVEIETVAAVEVTDGEVNGTGLYALNAVEVNGVLIPVAVVTGDGGGHIPLVYHDHGVGVRSVAYRYAEVLLGPVGILSLSPEGHGDRRKIIRVDGGSNRPVVGGKSARGGLIGHGRDAVRTAVSGDDVSGHSHGGKLPVEAVAVVIDEGPTIGFTLEIPRLCITGGNEGSCILSKRAHGNESHYHEYSNKNAQ